mgnify:CR=1 FL=1
MIAKLQSCADVNTEDLFFIEWNYLRLLREPNGAQPITLYKRLASDAEFFCEAISLVCVDEHVLLRDIERLLKQNIEKRLMPGFEPDPSIRAEPIENGRNKGRQGKPGGQRSAQRGSQAPGKAVRGSGGSGRTTTGRHSGTRHH